MWKKRKLFASSLDRYHLTASSRVAVQHLTTLSRKLQQSVTRADRFPFDTTRLFAKSQTKETVLKCTELLGITTLSTNQEGTIERHHPGREGKETLSKTKIFIETLTQRSTLELLSNDTFGRFVQIGEFGSVDLGDDVSLSL